jgi:hypothetical protein
MIYLINISKQATDQDSFVIVAKAPHLDFSAPIKILDALGESGHILCG